MYPQAIYAAFTFGLKHGELPIFLLLSSNIIRYWRSPIPVITGHTCTVVECDLLPLPVRMGCLGITNLCHIVASEYEASIAITEPLVRQIATQTHELPDDDATRALQQCKGRDKDARHREDLEEVKSAFPEWRLHLSKTWRTAWFRSRNAK